MHPRKLNFAAKSLINLLKSSFTKDAALIAAITAKAKVLIDLIQKLDQEAFNYQHKILQYQQELQELHPEINLESSDSCCLERSVNATDELGKTALHWAAEKGYAEIVEYLLAVAASSIVDTSGETPFTSASYFGHTKIVYLLSKSEITPEQNGTALIHAAKRGHTAIVNFLLNNKANPASTKEDKTALDHAIERQYISIIFLLLQHGAVINQPQQLSDLLINVADQGNHEVYIIFQDLLKQHKSKLIPTPSLQTEDEYKKTEHYYRNLHSRVRIFKNSVSEAIAQYIAPTLKIRGVLAIISDYDMPLEGARMRFFTSGNKLTAQVINKLHEQDQLATKTLAAGIV